MKIEQFGCKKAEGVYQEFYAHLFCMNLVALFGHIANHCIEKKTVYRKWQYKYNWQNAYRFLREKMMEFLLSKTVQIVVEIIIKQITRSIIAIKPDRWFVRDTRDRNKKGSLSQNHK